MKMPTQAHVLRMKVCTIDHIYEHTCNWPILIAVQLSNTCSTCIIVKILIIIIMPRPTVHCTCVYMCTVISVGASMQSEHTSMQALAVTGIGSNDGKRQGVPYAYLFSASYSSCPKVLGSAESHASIDNIEKVGRTFQSLWKMFANTQ